MKKCEAHFGSSHRMPENREASFAMPRRIEVGDGRSVSVSASASVSVS
jgi:hypothetical protein